VRVLRAGRRGHFSQGEFMSLLSLAAALAIATAPAQEPASVVIEYSLTQRDSNRVLVEGSMPLSPDRQFQFRQKKPRSEGTMVLNLRTRVNEPNIVIEVDWQEDDSGGRSLMWTPLLSIKRGEAITASVNWGGEGRQLTVKAH
jgi:hypothetical protein